MEKLKLEYLKDHIFIEVNDNRLVFDTGSPQSFGNVGNIEIDSKKLDLPRSLGDYNAESLSEDIGISCDGLIGTDKLNQYDHIIDIANKTLTVSQENLEYDGNQVPLDFTNTRPTIDVVFGNNHCKMFFDTGSKVCYVLPEIMDIETDPTISKERVEDFYPNIGKFTVAVSKIPVSIGDREYNLLFGNLPKNKNLEQPLLRAHKLDGIIGNPLILQRPAGYFPRSHRLIL